MANRSYLFATDLLPARGVKAADGHMTGISEWNYDIPWAFKLLMTGNPRKCVSSIWQEPEEIAVVGDYRMGVSRLLAELDKIEDPRILNLRSEAREFLSEPKNQRKFLVLECGEIYDMIDEPNDEQNDCLWKEICAMSTSGVVDAVPEPPKPRGLLARLFGSRRTPRARVPDVETLGLGNWTNVLYYDPTAAER